MEMLEEKDELKPDFIDLSTGETKSVECVRVDGAGDEGPTHEEVQFYWTRRHLLKIKVATLVTSYLNRVELQNNYGWFMHGPGHWQSQHLQTAGKHESCYRSLY